MHVTMREIIRRYGPGPGRHWFDRNTMRFFGSRLARHGYEAANGAVYFVSSEESFDGARRYSVRRLTPGGMLETVGEYGQYSTSSGARRAAMRLAGR